MKIAAPALCLLLLACSQGSGLGNDDALYSSGNAAALSPGVQPVRIGEGGPAFQACAGIGQVVNLSPAGEAYLPVRTAPFAEADEVARLADGARMFLCTRSLDQRWQGVVIPPVDTGVGAAVDCGVSAPVASPRSYAGPCQAGWVASAFVRASAD